MRILIAFLVFLVILGPVAVLAGCSAEKEFPEGITGTVYEDLNANGMLDEDEPGIGDVVVSNGVVSRLTDKTGEYNLSGEGSFVFVSAPGGYAPTTGWYADLTVENADFGLRRAPEKEGPNFSFVQLTDIHLDESRVSDLEEVVSEVNGIAPDFVMITGDLAIDANSATEQQAEAWFDLYMETMADLEAPLFHAIGNHDLVGINDDVPVSAKGLFEATFGPTYYSFDWGGYHFIVLDPHDLVDGEYIYQISEKQLKWLEEDLALSEERPLMVFYHEPTTSWENRSEVLELLGGRDATFYCGHSHMDLLMDTEGFPEQITGAVCGEWWFGNNISGQPPGYRIVSVSGGSIDSLYRWTGSARVIDPGLSSPVVSGQVDLRVRLFSEYGAPSEVTYQIGEGLTVPMDISDGDAWSVATAVWDASSLEEGYYALRVNAVDSSGSFEDNESF